MEELIGKYLTSTVRREQKIKTVINSKLLITTNNTHSSSAREQAQH
jgi:hypothetical protein